MLKRTTVCLDPKLHRALKRKAIHLSVSVSELINEALQLSLKEDALDIQAVKDRAHERARSYEAMIKIGHRREVYD